MIKEKIEQAATFIQSLNQQEFKKYLIITLTVIGTLALISTYYVYHTNESLAKQINALNLQINKIKTLSAQSEQLLKEEESIKELIGKHPDFEMSSYFENFYTKNKITPEPNWKPEEGTVIEGSTKGVLYKEIVLMATFKNQTMQKLVTIINDIYRDKIIYLKNVDITSQGSKINFDLTIATKQMEALS